MEAPPTAQPSQLLVVYNRTRTNLSYSKSHHIPRVLTSNYNFINSSNSLNIRFILKNRRYNFVLLTRSSTIKASLSLIIELFLKVTYLSSVSLCF